MSPLLTKAFWLDSAERAVKTVAGAEAAALSAAGVGLINAPWWGSLSMAGMAGVLSVLMSIASAPVADNGTASLLAGITTVDASGKHAAAPFVGGDTPA